MGLASPLEAITEDQIDRQFDVNFKGVFFAVQKAAPLLANGGSIVVTTSFLNEVGTPGLSILSATKAAGLFFYGPDRIEMYRRAAGYVDRILKGEKPADMLVQAPTSISLSSTSRSPRHLASRCHKACSPAPMR
jgi:hypothetical protein